MTSLGLNIFSPSESELLKSLLKNPEEDFEKLVSLLEKNTIGNSKKLKELEDKYYSLIDGLTHVGIGMDIVSKEYEIIFQNQVLKERFGDCKEKHCYRVYMGLKEPCEFCPMENALRYKRIERTELDAPDGRSYELISAPYPNKDGSIDKVVEVVIDITDRKRVEQKLKESEEKYRYFIENSIEGLWVIDEHANTVLVNPSMANILGYKIEEMMGESLFTFMDEEAIKLTKYHLEKRKRGISEERDTVMIHKNGNIVHLRIRATPIFDAEDLYEGTYAFLTDITDQFEAEQKLKESEEKYRVLTEQSLLGIFIIQKGRLKYINQAVSDINGYSVEEMLNWTQTDIAKTIYHEDLTNIMKSLKRSEAGDLDEYSSSIFRIVSKTGKIRWVKEFNKMIVFQGESASLVTLIDITDKIETEEKFRTITEQSFMGIFILQEGKFKYANKTLSDIIGYPLEKILKWSQNKIFRKIHPDDFSKITDSYRKNLQGDPVEMRASQFRFKHKNGDYIWLETFSKRIEFENNPATLTSIVDITDKKTSEQKIRESEEKYRSLFENMNAGFAYHEVIVDNNNRPIDYKFLEVNPAFEKMTGMKKENIIGKTVTEAIPGTENDPVDWIGRFGQVGLTGVPLSLEEYSEAINKWFNVSGYSPKRGFFAVTFTDITEKRKAEQKLKESEENFRTIAEDSHLAITILQNDLVVYTNQKMADLFGYDRKEMLTWTPKEYAKTIAEDSLEFVMEQARKKQIGDHNIITQYPIHCVKSSGEKFWVDNISATINYNGRPADLVTIIDTTEKREAEQKLKESEEKFRKITEESLLAICIVQDNAIKYINHEMAALFGYTVEEMLNWGPGKLLKTVGPESLETVKEQLKKKQAGDPDVIIHYPIQSIKKNGEEFWVDNLSKTIVYEGRPADLITQIDITERIKAQQELVNLNQLKSELLRRTSHELKTPLVSIKGFTELLLEVYRDKIDPVVISTLNEIMQGCNRLENLIGDILKTAELESGATKLQKSKENLSFLVRVCVNEIKGFSKLRNHIINLELKDNLMTSIEKEQIHQVISNLLNNAVKYTPPGGLIEINSEIRDNFVIISIKDNGIGFTEEEKGMIFKQFGKIERYGQGLDIIAEGSGFGLFISKKIIELHGGEIWVHSEGRYKGSTFYLSLPLI